MRLSRRDFIQTAAAMGASLAWVGQARGSRINWRERRDLYPEGVASGDPDAHSVILWTRRPFDSGKRQVLTVEVAEDKAFRRTVAQAPAPVSASSVWTSRVLVGGLKPAHVYWYRFTDAQGMAAVSAAPSRRRARTIQDRSTSPLSVAQASTRASSTATAG